MRSGKTIATPPGATIKEQLEECGMNQKELSVLINVSEEYISLLIKGDIRLTPDIASRLEHAMGIPAQFWMNLETVYQEKCTRIRSKNAADSE